MSINRQIQFVRGNTQCINQYTGPIGSLAINTDNYNIHVQDGVTPGGYVVSGGGTTYGNSNVAAYLIANGYLTSATANLNIYAWNANVNAVISSLNTYAWNANVPPPYGNANVASYLAGLSYTNYSNVNVAAYLNANDYSPYSNVNVAVFTNLSNYAYNANVSNYGNTNVRSYLGAFDGNIVPSANSVYSLGSITNQWRDLFVSNNTIYINGIPLGINASNDLTVNGNVVGAGSNYSNANVASYLPTYSGNIAANISKAGYTWTFGTNGNLTSPTGAGINNGYPGGTIGDGQGWFVTPSGNPGGVASADGQQYVQVNDGYGVEIGTGWPGNVHAWHFGLNGTLTLPTTGRINFDYLSISSYSDVSTFYAPSGNVQLAAGIGDAKIVTNSLGSSNTWTFGTDGNITLPTNTAAINYANGVSILTGIGSNYSNVNVQAFANLSNYAYNANVTAANVGIIGYIDQANTIQSNQISAANVGMQGYVDLANSIQSAQITNLANNMYTNANVQAYSVVWTSDLRPSANATYNLGNTTNQWNSITANALSINSGTISGLSIGYRDIPQVTLSSNVSITTSDAGKHYYSTVSANPQTLTIANNASQAFSIGATINVINGGTANIIITQGSGVTLYLAGNATASNRTLSSYGIATITKVATDTWYCVGVGLA